MTARLLRIAAACSLILGATVQASAQADYPNKPIRIITHSAPGGGPDAMLRIVGDRLGAVIGQPIVVLNQPGAGGAVAARAGASATPDGYTLYMPAASAYRDAVRIAAEPAAAARKTSSRSASSASSPCS